MNRQRLALASAAVTLAVSGLCIVPTSAITPVACGKPVAAANGTHGPVLCPGGAPNKEMRSWLVKSAPHVMALKAVTTDAQIREAACSDVALENATGPLVTDAYTYQYARYNWKGKHLRPAVFDMRLGVEFDCGRD